MVPIQQCPRYRCWLDQIRGHVSRPKIRAAMLGLELCLHVYTLLEKDTF